MRQLIILLAISASGIFISEAQPQTYKATHLSLAEGLSQSSVMDIVQDTKGFVWMSTQDGLNRYDGTEFKVFREEPFDSTSISSNNLNPLHVDSKGRLWVGTVNHGLNLYVENSNKFLHFKSSDNSSSISGNLITDISEDRSGRLWIGTATGLNRLVESTNDNGLVDFSFEHINLLDANHDSSGWNHIIDIYYANDNKLWVATRGGLLFIDLNEPLNSMRTIKYFAAADEYSGNFVWNISGTNDNLIWISTRYSVKILDGSSGELVRTIKYSKSEELGALPGVVHNFLYDSNGNLWLGIYDKGIRIIKKEYVDDIRTREPLVEIPDLSEPMGVLNAGMNVSLMEDKITPGMIWAGFTAGGALKLTPVTKRFFTSRLYGSNVKNAFVSSIVKDEKGLVWIGTTAGLVRHDRSNNDYKLINPLLKNGNESKGTYVNGVATDGNGNIYFSSGSSIYEVLDQHSGKPKPIKVPLPDNQESGFVRMLYTGPDGNVYVLTRFALFRIDSDNNTVAKLMEEENSERREDQAFFFSTMFIDHMGSYWIGGSTGLNYYKSNGQGNLPEFSDPVVYIHDPTDTTSLRNHNILGINADRDNHLWIGTFNGFSKLAGNGTNATFINYSTKQGLKNNMVYCVLRDKDKGYLWLSTNNGLTEFDPAGYANATYDVHDGLQSNEFNSYAAFEATDGELFFGGINGYSAFYPDQIVIDKTVPRVSITDIIINGSEHVNLAELGDDKILKLPYKNNSFTIEFIGLHYADPSQNQYAYKLEGLEDDWISTGNSPSVNFSQLAPGEYKFLIKASNSDGVFGNESDSITFVVKPPFYMTVWFYLTVIVFVSGVLYGLHKYKLSLKVAQMKEIDNIRKATAADFHDELGHKLTIINWFARILKKKIGPEQTDLKPHLDKIIETSGTLYHTMKDMLWAMDPDKDSVYDIYNQLCEFGQELFDSTGVTFESDEIPGGLKEKLLSPAHKRHVLLIFKEVMNNSLKHAHGKSTHLSLERNEHNIRFMFKDDGKGFVMNGKNVGNGLNNVKRRAKLINAEINIKNDVVGTVAELEIVV